MESISINLLEFRTDFRKSFSFLFFFFSFSLFLSFYIFSPFVLSHEQEQMSKNKADNPSNPRTHPIARTTSWNAIRDNEILD